MTMFVFHPNSVQILILIVEQCKCLTILPEFCRVFIPTFDLLCSSPTLGLNAQVGDGPVAPSFGVGGQFNTQNGQLQPTFGTGLK